MTAPAFAAAAPSCDLFRQRLENAPTVLKLRNLPQKIELTPVSTSFNQQVWKSEVGGGKDRIPLSAHVYFDAAISTGLICDDLARSRWVAKHDTQITSQA